MTDLIDAHLRHLEAAGRSGDTIDDRDAIDRLQLSCEIRHAGAAEHDGFRSIIGKRSLDFRPQLSDCTGRRIFKLEDGNIRSANLRASTHAVALDKIVDENA